MKAKVLAVFLVLSALGIGLKGLGSLAQGGAQLPPELNNAYIRDLAAKARAEGGVINSYGMPNDWANYGEIFAEFQRLFGIRQQDIDMGSAVVLARMREEKASKNDIADLKPAFAMTLAEEGLTLLPGHLLGGSPPGAEGGREGGLYLVRGLQGHPGLDREHPAGEEGAQDLEGPGKPRVQRAHPVPGPRATGTGVATIMAAAYALTGDPYNYKAGVDFFARLHKLGVIGAVEPR